MQQGYNSPTKALLRKAFEETLKLPGELFDRAYDRFQVLLSENIQVAAEAAKIRARENKIARSNVDVKDKAARGMLHRMLNDHDAKTQNRTLEQLYSLDWETRVCQIPKAEDLLRSLCIEALQCPSPDAKQALAKLREQAGSITEEEAMQPDAAGPLASALPTGPTHAAEQQTLQLLKELRQYRNNQHNLVFLVWSPRTF
jgi:hypothetical protein